MADVYHRATSSGSFKLFGATTGTTLNVNAYYNYTEATGLTQVWGSVKLVGNTLSGGGAVATLEASEVTLNATASRHARITSKPFTFYNPSDKAYEAVHLVVELTQAGAHGQGGFQVLRNSDGKVLAQSIAGVSTQNGTDGTYAEVPFTSGNVTITM